MPASQDARPANAPSGTQHYAITPSPRAPGAARLISRIPAVLRRGAPAPVRRAIRRRFLSAFSGVSFEEFRLPPPLFQTVVRYSEETDGMMDGGKLNDVVKGLLYSEPRGEEIVLELGTFRGNTASLLAEALRRVRARAAGERRAG